MGKPKAKRRVRNEDNVTPIFGNSPDGMLDENGQSTHRKQTPTGQKFKKNLVPRNDSQRRLVHSIDHNDVVFGVGPAGTGKTLLAVSKGIDWLRNEPDGRLILTRPAIEAGERLGFLPGDAQEKVDPYMQPLYDACLERVSGKQLKSWMAEKRVEIAPLAFMRGRSLGNAYIIVDEAQNCTYAQMKMIYTRLGMGSKMVFTGDPSQSDIGPDTGYNDFWRKLDCGIQGIGIVQMTAADIVRHPVLQATHHLI